MNTDALVAAVAAADRAALAGAAAAAEEALACHRAALLAIAEGWRSESGCAVTDDLRRQCAEAADIVAELHQAAADLALLRDGWAGSDDTAAASADGESADVQTAGQPVAPEVNPSAPVPEALDGPAAQPGGLPGGQAGDGSWSAQSAGAPAVGAPGAAWGASAATAPPGPAWPSPALPDLGGSLVNLVAHIAEALGSYSGAAEAVPVEEPLGPPSTPEAHPPPPKPDPPPAASNSGPPGDAVPEAPVAQPAAAPEAPPQQALAAERPADPGLPPVPAPATAGAPPAPAQEPSAAEPPPPPAAGPRKPCEIAADELAKVGE